MAGTDLLSFREWSQPPGLVTTWVPTAVARAAAQAAHPSPVPPSVQQRQHVRAYERYRALGVPMARLSVIAWREAGVCDIPAMTRAFDAHLRRHDTYASRFVTTGDGEVERRVITDPLEISLEPVAKGLMAWEDWQASLLDTPGPTEWDCFRFHVVQYDDSFTVCMCLDHLNNDGRFFVVFGDIHDAYAAAVAGRPPPALEPTSSYLEYCERQAARVRGLTPECTQVRGWLEFLCPADESSRAPLPVGDVPMGTTTAPSVHTLMDAAAAEAFHEACRAVGCRFLGGTLAVVARAWTEITGATTFRAITPTATADDHRGPDSLGWYVGVVPVVVPVADRTLEATMAVAQEAYSARRDLAAVPPDAVLDLIGTEPSPDSPDWSAPMISLHDLTRAGTGGETRERWQAHHGIGAPIEGASRQISLWVIRDHASTRVTVSVPDTPEAHRVKDQLVERMTELFRQVVIPVTR